MELLLPLLLFVAQVILVIYWCYFIDSFFNLVNPAMVIFGFIMLGLSLTGLFFAGEGVHDTIYEMMGEPNYVGTNE